MYDARDPAPVLGLDDQDVAPVALGDNLVLQVLLRVLAAQVRLECAAKAGPLFAEAIADDLQFRAGMVDDLAGGIDLVARLRDLALEGRNGSAGLVEKRERGRDAANRGACLLHR